MFFCAHGVCEVLDASGKHVYSIWEGMFFGEVRGMRPVSTQLQPTAACLAALRRTPFHPLFSICGDYAHVRTQVAVLFSIKCTASVRTISYCDLLSLSKESLREAMRDYPKVGEMISEKAKARMAELGIKAVGQ